MIRYSVQSPIYLASLLFSSMMGIKAQLKELLFVILNGSYKQMFNVTVFKTRFNGRQMIFIVMNLVQAMKIFS